METFQNKVVSRESGGASDRLGEPRICMPTFSAFSKHAFRAGLREAQDVLAACDAVDFIELEPSSGFRFKEHWLMRLTYHDPTRRVVSLNPGLRPVRLTKDYDLFVLVCAHWRDLWYANAIPGWRDHCKTSICWIDELWAKDAPTLERWLPILNKFEHIIVGVNGSSEALSDVIGRHCDFMPGAVDAIRFSPYPNPSARVIDIYSIGRRHQGVHRALLDLAARREFFYVHDTFQTGDSQTPDHREHREMYANFAKRSRFFVLTPGKANVPHETGGQADISFRYFEGSAAGAVLIGQKPDCEPFRQMFDWPEAVIEIEPDGSDAAGVILNLLAEPEQLREISSRNAEEALRRHDWVYRWRQIFDIAGLDPTPAMEAREKRLSELRS